MSTHRGILASSLSCLCWAPMEAVEYFFTRKIMNTWYIYIYLDIYIYYTYRYIILYMYTLYYITMFLMTCDEYEFVVLNSVYVSRSPSSDTLSMSIQRSHNFGLDITSFGGELAIKTCPPKLIFIQLFRKPSVFFFAFQIFRELQGPRTVEAFSSFQPSLHPWSHAVPVTCAMLAMRRLVLRLGALRAQRHVGMCEELPSGNLLHSYGSHGP